MEPIAYLKLVGIFIIWVIIDLILRFSYLSPIYYKFAKQKRNNPILFKEYAFSLRYWKRYWYLYILILIIGMYFNTLKKFDEPLLIFGILGGCMILFGIIGIGIVRTRSPLITEFSTYRIARIAGKEEKIRRYYYAQAILSIAVGYYILKIIFFN